jgi:hypothetical protein
MLVFQTANVLVTMAPGVIKFLGMAWRWAWRKFFPDPADRFAAVVRAVMSQNESILARKYADRWLLRVHGRGLNERALCHHEKAQQLLPFDLRALRPALTRMRAFGGGNRRQGMAAGAAAAAVAEVEAGGGGSHPAEGSVSGGRGRPRLTSLLSRRFSGGLPRQLPAGPLLPISSLQSMPSDAARRPPTPVAGSAPPTPRSGSLPPTPGSSVHGGASAAGGAGSCRGGSVVGSVSPSSAASPLPSPKSW